MQQNRVKQGLAVLAVAVCVFMGRPALAEEITWLTDYGRARDAAQSLNRPLLLGFGSKDSSASRKMYETTLRDPITTGIITREFVCCKMEAEQDDYLIPRLKIQSFPTLVFAAADGTILHRVVGLDEANPISMHIDEALRRAQTHEEVKRARTTALQNVDPTRQAQFQSPYATSRMAGQDAGKPYGNTPSYWYPAPANANPSYPPPNYTGPTYFSTNYFTPTLPHC
jgi:hypothetical protein